MLIRVLAAAALAGLLVAPAPSQCTITQVAPGCGPTMTVTLTPGGQNSQKLRLRVEGLAPNMIGAFVFGLNLAHIGPLDPLGLCFVETDYVWGHTFTTDKFGVGEWGRAWPDSYLGYFYMQMGGFVADPTYGFVPAVSNCNLVDCRMM